MQWLANCGADWPLGPARESEGEAEGREAKEIGGRKARVIEDNGTRMKIMIFG